MMDKETRMGAIRALQDMLAGEMQHYDRIVGAVAGLSTFDQLGEGHKALLGRLSGLRIELDRLRDCGHTDEECY